MPIPQYSVLKGDPISGGVKFNSAGRNPHYHITLQGEAGTFDIAVNIQSEDGSEILYVIDHAFLPPDAAGLAALPMAITALDSEPGGLALDYVRLRVAANPMVHHDDMQLLPVTRPSGHRHNDLQNEVIDMLNRATSDPEGIIYAFGSAYPDGSGIHDIHMNQGNPPHSHDQDNGIWQDGAVFVNLPAQKMWLALFTAFQTQSWQTGDSGNQQ